jgi:hypothetical protein
VRCAHPREGRLSLDDPVVRLAYRQLVEPVDPARSWLDAGAVDARFGGDLVPPGAVVRGAGTSLSSTRSSTISSVWAASSDPARPTARWFELSCR